MQGKYTENVNLHKRCFLEVLARIRNWIKKSTVTFSYLMTPVISRMWKPEHVRRFWKPFWIPTILSVNHHKRWQNKFKPPLIFSLLNCLYIYILYLFISFCFYFIYLFYDWSAFWLCRKVQILNPPIFSHGQPCHHHDFNPWPPASPFLLFLRT
jgi:hypothetical protein